MLVSFVKKGQCLFIATFMALIFVGTLLLAVPWWAPDKNYSLLNAMFTATSAVCVTGLTTNDVCEFSFPGQLIIIILVQLGGIGIMTLSASILLALGRGLSINNTLLISGLNDNFSLRGTEGLTLTVVKYTLACEAVGAVVIYIGLMFNDPVNSGFGTGELKDPMRYLVNAWNAVFLSISGFCNAGFSPIPGNLCRTNAIVQFTAAGLSILGGLGVYVIYDLWELIQKRRNFLRLHSKVALLTTGILLLGGTLFLVILSVDSGRPLSVFESFCLSAYARTAGFTLVENAMFTPGVSLLLIVLMLIGGSPGSTAGGMKTTTLAVVFAAIRNTLLGNHEVLIFKRNVGVETVLRSFTIMVLFLFIFFCGGTILHILNPIGTPLIASMFEAASALTTNGLSLGMTTELTSAGKVCVIILMMIGRLGPFTILLFLLSREKPGQLKYPHERLIIG